MRIFRALGALAVGLTLASAAASPAEATFASVTVTRAGGTKYVNVRSAPTPSSTNLGLINAGQRVGLQCAITGAAVSGPYGTTKLWYRVDGSKPNPYRYVSDAYLETGSNSAVTPYCGPTGMKMPFKAGTTHQITQQPGNKYSHADAYNKTAVDWSAGYGEAVQSSAAGKVYAAGWTGTASGIEVLVQIGTSANCVQYVHLSAISVKKGQQVSRGQQVGKAGGSGYGKQGYWPTHLHWAIVNCSSKKAALIPTIVETGSDYRVGLRLVAK